MQRLRWLGLSGREANARGEGDVSDTSSWVMKCPMELIILIVVIAVVALVLLRGGVSVAGLIINGIVGVVLIFLTNLILSPPIPITLITVLICAIGGVLGWLIILVLHLVGITL